MKNKLVITTVCAAALASTALVNANAAPKSSPSPSPSAHASPAAKKETATTRAIPFHGTIASVDQAAKTFTIAGKEKSRVFKITDTTVITKGGAAATMNDIVANEQVSGSYLKVADGSLEAKTVKVGPKTDKATKKKSSKKDASAEASPSPSPSPKP